MRFTKKNLSKNRGENDKVIEMGLSYTEELVSEYFKHLTDDRKRPKYMVSEHVQFQAIETKKKVKGWKDIDILAIGKDEICIIQTKSYAIFKKTVKESVDSAKQYFEDAEEFVAEQYDIKDKKIRKIFIADFGLSKNFQTSLSSHGIETIKLRDIFIRYLNILYNLYPDIYHLGKEENNVTRILMFLSYSFRRELESCGLLKVKEKLREIKKNAGTPTDPTITYRDAYLLFQDRNFRFFQRGDYTELVIPLAVTIKRFHLPPDAFAVYLNTESSKLHLYSPSQDGGEEQISDKLDDSEISWITEFLNHKGRKFNEKMWSVSQKDFWVLEVLCQERNKAARKRITSELNPYTPSENIVKIIETMGKISGL